jgi:hypothetical protein
LTCKKILSSTPVSAAIRPHQEYTTDEKAGFDLFSRHHDGDWLPSLITFSVRRIEIMVIWLEEPADLALGRVTRKISKDEFTVHLRFI